MHERCGGDLGCRGVDLRGGSGLDGVGPQFCQTTRESLAWIRFRLLFTNVLRSLTYLEEEVSATTKGAIEMILERYPPSNRDSCLQFRVIKVMASISSVLGAVVGLE